VTNATLLIRNGTVRACMRVTVADEGRHAAAWMQPVSIHEGAGKGGTLHAAFGWM
jgi:hypothetical protein